MSNSLRIPRLAWLVFPILALAYVGKTTFLREGRVAYVSDVAGRSGASPTDASGNAPWQPRLVVPDHHNESYEWLDLTRQMFAKGEWRVRHVDYENAPSGREVFAPSPYRWWLGLVTLLHSGVTHAPVGPSLEWAALYADPLLLLVSAAATVLFVARRFGVWAAALTSVTLTALFPMGAAFIPGVPDDLGLTLICIVWSVLPILVGASPAEGADPGRARRWFVGGGVAGGVGVWIGASHEVPILFGIAIGALAAAWVAGRSQRPLPWRSWGLAGGATCLGAYMIEFFPSHMGVWELREVHPVFGLAWIGGAELLARAVAWIGGEEKTKRSLRGIATGILAVAAVASLPAALGLERNLAFLSVDLQAMRLSLLTGAAKAPNLWSLLLQNGVTRPVWATVLPLLFLVPAGVLLVPRLVGAALRVPIALALGPVAVAIGFAFRQIAWWNGVDATLIPLIIVMAAALRAMPRPRLVASAAAVFSAAVLLPGILELWPSSDASKSDLNETEVIGLVERDMAYWLAKQIGPKGAVVLAPPNLTATLYYYGGIRGLATYGWEDRDGFQTAVRVMSASTPEEAQELLGVHGATHVILPSWDPFMEAYAEIGAGQLGGTFYGRLHDWNIPRWLRPVPYLVPTIPGFESQSAIVFEIVDDQDDATALSRIAVYLADAGQLRTAARAAAGLRRFPADLGALLARAQVENATGETEDFTVTVDQLIRRCAGGADRDLPWDQRVGLAVVFAQAHHLDLARTRLQECMASIDEEKLRSLSTILLYRFHVLGKALNLDIADPGLRSLSFELLPADLRSRVE